MSSLCLQCFHYQISLKNRISTTWLHLSLSNRSLYEMCIEYYICISCFLIASCLYALDDPEGNEVLCISYQNCVHQGMQLKVNTNSVFVLITEN